MQVVQVEFGRTDIYQDVTLIKVIWVDASWNLREGNTVAFKGEATIWDVRKVYDSKIDVEQIHSKWGLDLPKSQRTER